MAQYLKEHEINYDIGFGFRLGDAINGYTYEDEGYETITDCFNIKFYQ
jgi:hypothetical protein